jgi:two-component system, LuxR family, sensor kinase FixL
MEHTNLTYTLKNCRPLRYVAAACLVAIALLITRRMQSLLGETISPLFFAAVMLSAWWGGLGPGLLATALAGVASAYFFVNPAGSGLVGWDDVIRLSTFLMVAVLISTLTSLRKRAESELRRANDLLEQRVLQRTSELRNSNSLLQQSEERFRLMVEGVGDYAIVLLDAGGKVFSWNIGAQRIFGYLQQEIIGNSVARFMDVHARVRLDEMLGSAARLGKNEEEVWVLRKNGTRFLANVLTTALRAEDQSVRGFAQITRDVTELRRLEREVLEISEAEQRRMGHDLHDGLGQELTGLTFLSANLVGKLAAEHRPETALAERIAALTGHTLQQARDMARGLSPMDVGPGGLHDGLAAVARHVREISRINCTLECPQDIEISNDADALHLFRIAQQAANNAVRHSGGKHLAMILRPTEDGLDLIVEDDGVGLPPAGQRGKGLGLHLMDYRARMIGASMRIESRQGGGTRIACHYFSAARPAEPQPTSRAPAEVNTDAA